MLIRRNLHKKSCGVSITTRSTPTSLSLKGEETKHTTVKWFIPLLPVAAGCVLDGPEFNSTTVCNQPTSCNMRVLRVQILYDHWLRDLPSMVPNSTPLRFVNKTNWLSSASLVSLNCFFHKRLVSPLLSRFRVLPHLPSNVLSFV